jgi:hypothetical protein
MSAAAIDNADFIDRLLWLGLIVCLAFALASAGFGFVSLAQ